MDACWALAQESKGLQQLLPSAFLVLAQIDVAVADFIAWNGSIILNGYQVNVIGRMCKVGQSVTFNPSTLHYTAVRGTDMTKKSKLRDFARQSITKPIITPFLFLTLRLSAFLIFYFNSKLTHNPVHSCIQERNGDQNRDRSPGHGTYRFQFCVRHEGLRTQMREHVSAEH